MNKQIIKAISLIVQADGDKTVPPMLWGQPGVGKTSIIKQIAQTLGRALEIVIASSKDPADVIGMDYVVDDKRFGKKTQKMPPSWAVRAIERADQNQKTIVFFDEITTAPQMVQNVLLSTMQDYLLGDTELPRSHVTLVAAGNPSDITGETLSQAMANRLVHFDCSYNRDAFVRYLQYGGVTEKDIATVNPNHQKKFRDLCELLAIYISNIDDFVGKGAVNEEAKERAYPSPRSAENMLKLLSLVDDNDPDSVEIENLFASGTVGGDGLKFLVWIRKRADLPSVEDVLNEKVTLNYEKLDLVLLFAHQVVNEFRKIFNTPDRPAFVQKLVKFAENLCDHRIEVVPVLLDPIVREYTIRSAKTGRIIPIDDALMRSPKLGNILHKLVDNR